MQSLQTFPELSFEDLRKELERIRGSMPKRTLYHWLDKMGMMPNSHGFYTCDDLEVLKRLNRFLKQVPSIEKFKSALRREAHNAY